MKILTDRKIKTLFVKIALTLAGHIVISVLFLSCAPAWLIPAGILLSSLMMALVIIWCCWRYLTEQSERIESAAAKITEYIAGDLDARIECDEEGELYKLFHRINSLATILNARAENGEKARAFLKDTISDISHQLKTPIAALNIYNGILQGEAKEQPVIREFTDLSEQELDRMENLVQNLLKLTKLDAGTILLEKTPENVSDMMESIEKHFAFRARQEGKELLLSGGEEMSLCCDRTWLTEAIGNIVKNALDHTRKGDAVRISWQRFSQVIQIRVEDNGNGIHPEDLHHIFKRFYRSRFSKNTQGIGLGLPLAKAVIEAHNGTVEVDSRLGEGTVFLVNFLL